MAKKYTIVIEELCAEEFAVEAESEAEALKRAIEKYKSGDFILSPGNVESRQLKIANNEDDAWIRF